MSPNFEFLLSLALLISLCVLSIAQRPDCSANVAVKTKKLTTLNFDDIAVVPCKPFLAENPVSGVLLFQSDETPSYIYNTTTTSTCHGHSGGGGIFNLAPSLPNAVYFYDGGLILLPANNKSLTFVSLELKINCIYLIRAIDPVVIVRALGYDACGNEVTRFVKSFTNMQYNQNATLFSVQGATETFKDLAKVEIKAYTVRFDTYFVGYVSNSSSLVGDNLKYYVDRN
ncbi:hypothetical protein HK098_002608 [Nowakowskiella sp. JEL0407]|nr:hypothetical protein HK098_002608 [Nowakowskiella sp. JEL0407]